MVGPQLHYVVSDFTQLGLYLGKPQQHDASALGQAYMGPQFAYALSAQSRSGNAQFSPGRSLELGLGLGLPDWDPSRCIVVFGRRKCVIRRAEPGLELGLARLNTAGKPKACPVGPHSELLAGYYFLRVSRSYLNNCGLGEIANFEIYVLR